ncbi:MAG: protein translocase subunit SecD [Actinomycetota bacterium]
MKGYRRYQIRLAVIVIVAFAGLATVLSLGVSPSLGLDLKGGLSVILTASSAEGEVDEDVLDKTVEIIRRRIDALGVAEPEVSVAGTNNVLIQLPGIEDERRALEVIGSTAQLTFRQVVRQIPPSAAEKRRPDVTEEVDSSVNDETVAYPSADEPELLYELEPARLTGDVVTRAQPVPPQGGVGGWSVALEMTGDAAETWKDFTSDLACNRDEGPAGNPPDNALLAIVLDGKVESAVPMADPRTESDGGIACGDGIPNGESQINVTNQQEARDLTLVLQTGALPITLEQSEVLKVSPTLGEDSLEAGLRAGILGLALVMIYMVVYYRALGLVVWLGLAVFTAIIYTLIAVLGETAGLSLTLAGIAGIIVSVGVTADSYIVAFERLKDEAHSGKTMRAAVERGMTRSFRTILVADFVTGAAAVILFYLAVGAVKGFALTLGLATIVDVVVAYFFTRSAVQLLARSKTFSEGRFIGMKKALGVTGT